MNRTFALLTALAFALLAGSAAAQTGTGTTGAEDDMTASEAATPTTAGTDPASEYDDETLPATASPWPLVGLAGLVSLGGAAALRRRRR